ncbi:hypothetical protein M2419_002198 [Sphingobacterium sp. BIGb0116]|nr:hypothetical protein [Sphingobacterium sp. BIGb0116]
MLFTDYLANIQLSFNPDAYALFVHYLFIIYIMLNILNRDLPC